MNLQKLSLNQVYYHSKKLIVFIEFCKHFKMDDVKLQKEPKLLEKY